jgi:hypothetical protein
MTNLESASVKKMISDLASEGFIFHADYDETTEHRFGKFYTKRRLDNIVFEKDGIIIKIYSRIFFRETGLSHLFDESSQKPTKVTDEEFYEMQKHLIRYRFEQRLKHLKTPETENHTHQDILL